MILKRDYGIQLSPTQRDLHSRFTGVSGNLVVLIISSIQRDKAIFLD